MRTLVIAMILSLAATAAGPQTKPASRPAPKTRYTLMHGSVRFMIPGGWTQILHTEDDHSSQFQSPDGKCIIVVGVQPEETGFPAQSESMVEQMKVAVIRGMKQRLKERGVQVLYGPRSESDSDFVLRIHTRYVENKQTFDEMQTYRAAGLDLLPVLTQVKTDSPAEARSFWAIGDDAALGIVLGPADKKRPTSR